MSLPRVAQLHDTHNRAKRIKRVYKRVVGSVVRTHCWDNASLRKVESTSRPAAATYLDGTVTVTMIVVHAMTERRVSEVASETDARGE
jgi:hypothetical protein